MELSYEGIPPVATGPVTYEELKLLTRAASKVCSSSALGDSLIEFYRTYLLSVSLLV